MADDLPRKTPLTGEVLPPARPETHLPIEPPLAGIPLFNRMRYRAVRRELEEYLTVLQTRNAVLKEITETARIGEEYKRRLVRTERLDDLRRIEALKIDAEMDEALENAMRQHRDAQANALAHRARMANLEADAIEAERRLTELKNPPRKPEPPPPQDPSERMATEIARLREQERTLIASLLANYESEEDVSDEDRELIADIKLATRNRIASLVEDIDR